MSRYTYPFVLLLLWLCFFYLILGWPTGPIHGRGDIAGWEYSGYYLAELLEWRPFPWLTFNNNLHFYPKGISPVFMSWGLERDFFYAFFYSFFGQGPWLYYYFALSYLVLSLGAYLITRPYFGEHKSAIFAVALTYFNAYALNKFPAHFGIAIHHWTSLSVIIDFVIFYRLSQKKVPSLHLILGRILATFGSLGLELGYIGGLSLSSAVILVVSAGVVYFRSWFIERESYIGLKDIRLQWQSDFLKHKFISIALASLACIYAFLIIPTLISIMVEIKKWESQEILQGAWWSHPVRILFPFIQPAYDYLNSFLKDSPEGYASASSGWFLLICGLMGLVYAWKTRQWFVIPFALLFVAILFYHPSKRPLLKYFPWFAYARVGPRLSIILPTFLGCFALCFPWFKLKNNKWHIIYAVLLALLATVELPFIFSNRIAQGLPPAPDQEFFAYMDAIKEASGEAVLDFPFCYKGGNGGGFCPEAVDSVWANRKYHGKKVLGTYFGRLLGRYDYFYKPYGLHDLLEAQSQRCLTADELDHLKRFYESYDFCCLSLYIDTFDNSCRQGYFDTFGEPKKVAQIPGVGRAYLFVKANHSNLGSQKYHWSIYNLIEVLRKVQNLYSFSSIIAKENQLASLKLLEKHLSLPLKSFGEVSLTSPVILILPSEEKPEQLSARLITKTLDFDIYYYDASQGSPINNQFYSLFDRAQSANISGQLDFRLEIEQRQIFMHPSASAARLQFQEITVPQTGAYLSFGLKLGHGLGNAIFRIRINEDIIFTYTLVGEGTFLNIETKIPDKFNTSDVTLTLEIDPNGDSSFDWAYWVDPIIVMVK